MGSEHDSDEFNFNVEHLALLQEKYTVVDEEIEEPEVVVCGPTQPKPKTSAVKNDQTKKIQEEEDKECNCEANLFYKKYKSQVDTMMNQHLADKEQMFAEQKRMLESRRTLTSTTYFKQKRRKTRVKESSEVKDAKTRKSKQLLKFPEPEEQEHDADADKLEAIVEEEDQKTERTSLSYKGEEDTTASFLKDAHEEHVEFFSSALDDKIQHLFGLSDAAEESEAHTERGYYVFSRFAERSDEGTVYRLPSSSTSGAEEEQESVRYVVPRDRGEWMSESMRKALDYLKNHKVGELFRFMGAHLVSANPCNPIDYLINLLDNCLNYRMGYCEPPLLYTPKHIESLFFNMDPMSTGFIEMNQYHTGMFTLGVKDYNMFPVTANYNTVTKETFINEAYNQLKAQLNEMIQTFEIPLSISTFTPQYYPPDKGEGESLTA